MADKAGPLGLGFTHVSVVSDRIEVLQRLRARLSEEIDDGPCKRDLVLLAGQLRAVMAELEDLGVGVAESPADQITARRAARRKKSS